MPRAAHSAAHSVAHSVDGRDRPAPSSEDPPAHSPDRVNFNVPGRGSLLGARNAAGPVTPALSPDSPTGGPAAWPVFPPGPARPGGGPALKGRSISDRLGRFRLSSGSMQG